ncbi:MAG TPA: cytochrome c [Alphaproteobacteria bacterium]|jgi:cytochrome c556
MRILGTAISALALAAAVALAPIGAAIAGDGAAAITERQALMRLQGAAAGAIKSAIDSKDPARLKQVEGAARALTFSATAIPTMFPKGSDAKAGKTNALDKIWSDAPGFKKSADALGAAAAKLADALKSGDPAASLAAFGEVGKDGCGGCHGTYRAKMN